MRVGSWDVRVVSAGTFRLDGGSMFGIIPKVLWNKLLPADEANNILMATNCLLIQGEVAGRRRVVLVDNGNGDKEPEAFMARYQLEGRGVLTRNLAREGVAPEDVDLVILTHLHFDHAGGCTRLDGQERPVPAFPGARHLVQRQELVCARNPHPRERGSYLARNWEPLEAAGLLDTLEGACEVLPGLSVRPVPGHNAGIQAVVVEGEGRKVIFPSDLIPTSHHIQPAWVTGYDLDVNTCVEERLKLLREVTGTGAILVFEHDPDVAAGTVLQDARGRYHVTPVDLGA